MGTHLQQGTFEVPEGGDVNQLVQNVWNLGGYVRLASDRPNAIDVVCPAGIYGQIRTALQPSGGLAPAEGTEGTEGNPPVQPVQ